ncbi:hypothetical protein COCSUDRAFT_33921 [Coccomyxa subellipsoidea C-169]|uniref:Uncharacterized protein n=1 Tax=Coccomyxa subellipsoidea (strain C-169) TaxID=574566 RepID=I0YR58_COCSC|nr:hypothetical protein COCSUDRAFT_33921 [Coccomyxa subellipsoidea C-169]EIE20877.1 hypothetical protein COCSUDRAFT_33921 [Coccomyxa subellipsoidea C-169]|eukprot:XP_005645421.1 hypothetical protein COCSUDRAFT_33921 [Coccomyxa subellipsoidea C-169]
MVKQSGISLPLSVRNPHWETPHINIHKQLTQCGRLFTYILHSLNSTRNIGR